MNCVLVAAERVMKIDLMLVNRLVCSSSAVSHSVTSSSEDSLVLHVWLR